jgi:CRP-like cAMP-binding protein
MAKKEEIQHDCEHCHSRHKSIFCQIAPDEVKIINENKWCQSLEKGQQLFAEGAYPHGIFCVNTGKIKIHQMGEEGREQIVRFAKEGDVVGYRAMLAGEKYSSSATAIDTTSICFIPKNVIFSLIEKDSNFAIQLIKLLSNNLKHAEESILHLAQKPVRERMAESLLFLKEMYGLEPDGITMSVSLSREEIATLVGTATETAIRLLSEFKSKKLVSFEGRKIQIIDMPGLLKVANIHD